MLAAGYTGHRDLHPNEDDNLSLWIWQTPKYNKQPQASEKWAPHCLKLN